MEKPSGKKYVRGTGRTCLIFFSLVLVIILLFRINVAITFEIY